MKREEWSAWLIEDSHNNGQIRYMTMEDCMFVWTTDPLKALHFCRRQDAELIAQECEDAWYIREHLFLGDTLTAPTVPSEPGRYRMSVDVDVLQGPFTGDLWVTCNKKMAVLANLKYFARYGATFTREINYILGFNGRYEAVPLGQR